MAIQATGPKLQCIGRTCRDSLPNGFRQTLSLRQTGHNSSKEAITAPGRTNNRHLWSSPAKLLPISGQTNRPLFAKRDNDLPHAAFLQFQRRL